MTQFSDEDLTAFLDGEAEASTARAIEAALVRDPELSQRLADLHIDKDALGLGYDDLLAAAPVFPEETVARAPVGHGWLKIAAAALLALGLGWGIGAGRSDLGTWQDYAAAYHKLYVQETLSNTDFSDAALDAQMAVVSEAVGVDVTLADINGVDGLELRRAQVLGFEGSKIAHIALQDASGEPVALCITKSDGRDPVALQETLGMATASWSDGNHSYYLIGGADAALIARAASYFSKS